MKNQYEPKNFETVNKLCCCLGLKTGMSVIVGIKLGFSLLSVLLAFIQIIALVFDLEDVIVHVKFEGLTDMTAYVILLVANLLDAYVFYLFIKAVKADDASGILPYLVLNGVYIVFFFFVAVAVMKAGLFINLVVYIYIYICAYSLYSIFSNAALGREAAAAVALV